MAHACRGRRSHCFEKWPTALSLVFMVALFAGRAEAGNVLTPGAVNVDRPTVINLGVQLLISDDDNRNARVAVRYRKQGAPFWRNGMDLFRVHPEEVSGISLPQQFAGSIFNLQPNTQYEIELTATDPDGAVASIPHVTAKTRPVPAANPLNPTTVNVSTASQLSTALTNAAPGNVITLAAGTYVGNFTLNASGTADDPIVIRGAGANNSIINGSCSKTCTSPISGCTALDVHGSYVHIEDLSVQTAARGIWLRNIQTTPVTPTTANVVRRVAMTDVCIGISSVVVAGSGDQTDFYVCDNDLTGVVPDWPYVYADDSGAYANASGINIQGSGHVVCHNKLRRFGDALRIMPNDSRKTTRAYDLYGNDVLTAYDNGVELDYTQGNVRAFRNRFLNTYSTLSFQPVYGGPAYAFRNVVVNVAREQLKFSTAGGSDPSGMLVFHNTFVSPPLVDTSFTPVALALNLINEANTSHNYLVENNLFVGNGTITGLRTASWKNFIDEGVFDYDGYYPNGDAQRPGFRFGGTGAPTYPNFAALQAAGIETHGVIVPQALFASGLTAPSSYTTTVSASGADVTLASGTTAVNTGVLLPNLNDGYTGTNPDLGAREQGCALPAPIYGPRPTGTDETNEPIGCEGDVDGCRSNPSGTTCLDEGNGCTDDTCQSGVCTHTCAVGATGRCFGPFCMTNQTCQLAGSSCVCQ